MNTATDTLETNTPLSGGGYTVGQSAADLVGFYGATPIVRPSSAAQGVITDSSGGTANVTTGVAALTGTYNSAIIANALATIIAQNTAMRLALVNLGLIKGAV
jgi:hypothetical protein